MSNPSGPYPGRQLFLGLTAHQEPCLAYLVTGRSTESRQRKAVAMENMVVMGPLGNVPYDPLRHYTALKYDDATGIAAVSNGIQTEAIFETYKLLFNVGTPLTKDYLARLLDGANSEPDTLHTPRIGGIVIANKGNPVFILGIKTYNTPAAAYIVVPEAGHLSGIAVYKGDIDNPEPTNPVSRLSWLEFSGNTAQGLAQSLYDLSAATYKGEDIRVTSVAAIYSGNAWSVAIANRY